MSSLIESNGPDELLPFPQVDCLPRMLLALMERRYLSEFDLGQWVVSLDGSPTQVALRELVGIGKFASGATPSMAAVLSAWHDPGQSLVAIVHGSDAIGVHRHRFYFGSRRLPGGLAADEYQASQTGSLTAHFPGAELTNSLPLNERADLWKFLRTAPALAAITGIPSIVPAGSIAGLERLARSIGARHYAVVIVAEPLPFASADAALDSCRRLQSDISAFTSRQVSRTRGETDATDKTWRPNPIAAADQIPTYLQQSAYYVSLVTGQPILAALTMVASMVAEARQQVPTEPMVKESHTNSWSESASMTLVDATARSCDRLLEQHAVRIQSGRVWGWWKVAVYLAADDHATLHAVGRSLRAAGAGNDVGLDPMRMMFLPQSLLRDAILEGRLMNLRPAVSAPRHPLGPDYDAAATCMSSQELATIMAPPLSEIPGIRAREHSDFGVTLPTPDEDWFELGRVRDASGQDHGPAPITARALNEHVLIVGTPGSGKTNTSMQILLAAHEKLGVPFLVIEPAKAEYRQLRRQLGERLRIYSVNGPDDELLRLNPLSPVTGVPLLGHIDLLKAVFNASFSLYPGMPQILEQALVEVYQDRGWDLRTGNNREVAECSEAFDAAVLIPCLSDLHDQIELVMQRKGYAGEVRMNMGAALRSRLNGLMLGAKGLSLNVRRALSDEELFGRPVIVELQHLRDDEEKAFVMAVIFMRLYQYCEARQRQLPSHRHERLQHVTLIEEAHRLLANAGAGDSEANRARGKAIGMFTDMLAELRALGEGFMIAEQIPTKLTPDTLKNTNLKIIHRLTEFGERVAIGQSVNLDERQIQHLVTLPKGLAVVHGLSSTPDAPVSSATLVHVHKAKQAMAAQAMDHRPGIPPPQLAWRHGGCRSCSSPCNFLHRIEPELALDPQPAWIAGFCQALVGNSAERAWMLWTSWRKRCAVQRLTQGEEYCWFVHMTRGWVSLVVATRGTSNGAIDRLRPLDRLAVEPLAAGFGALASVWLDESALSARAISAFAEVGQQLRAKLQHGPPPEFAGCNRCPAQCQMLPYVAGQDRSRATTAIVEVMPRAGNDAFGNSPSVGKHWHRISNVLSSLESLVESPNVVDRATWSRNFRYCLVTVLAQSGDLALHRDETLSAILSSASIAADA